MSSSPPSLPENRQELVQIIDSLTTKNEQLEAKVRWFEEQFHLSRHKQFGHPANAVLRNNATCSTKRRQLLKRDRWTKLVRFLEDGRIEISNNRAERSIKPFVISRKNFLFCNTPRGARASATIFSIIESAKENGLNPYAYLNYLFEKLPNLDSRDDETLDQLLPWNVKLQ